MAWPFFGKKQKRVAAAPVAPMKKRRTMFSRAFASLFKASEKMGTDDWGTAPLSPDAFIRMRHITLVARSREQWSNNDYVRAFIRLVRQNVVGPQGIAVQTKATTPRGKLDKDLNAAVDADWLDFCQKGNCEVTGQLSMRELENLVIETTARDGEFFARKVYGDDAGPHGFAVQMIDPMRLPTWYEEVRNDGSFIRHGIEFNRYGRPIAYHFVSTDEWSAYYYTFGGHGFERIPADQIIHGFVHEMVGQRRGLPWASTSLFRLHHLQGFEDAAVQNARASATKMGFIQYRDGFGPEADEDLDVASTIEAEPLSFHELPEGAEFKDFNPNYPSGEFATFHKAMLRGAFSGMGITYASGSGDLEGVNFSSIRQGTLDEREHWKELQQWLIENFKAIVRVEWLKWRLLNGAIKVKGKPVPADKLADCKKCAWQPRRWSWIDPRADVQAAIESIRAGLTSISQVIRDQGRDPEVVFIEFAEDLKAMKAAGIPDEIIAAFLLGQVPPPAGDEPTGDEGKKGDEE